MSTLARVLEQKIKGMKPGEKEGIRKKLDIFYAADRITDDEYGHLVGLLDGRKEESPEEPETLEEENSRDENQEKMQGSDGV